MPSQAHPHHCDRLSGRTKTVGVGQQGVNDLVSWAEKQEIGVAKAGSLGKESSFLTVERDFISISADVGREREILRRNRARERWRE